MGFLPQTKTTDFPYVYTHFVILSECEESPLVRSNLRINADPSLTLRMTDQTLKMTDHFNWFHGSSVQNTRHRAWLASIDKRPVQSLYYIIRVAESDLDHRFVMKQNDHSIFEIGVLIFALYCVR